MEFSSVAARRKRSELGYWMRICSKQSSASGPTFSTERVSPLASLSCARPAPSHPARRDKVLFINADREYHEGRAQNELLPEHVERIVSAFGAFESIPMFAHVVTREGNCVTMMTISTSGGMRITTPPEPQDVQAHLKGGVPKAEVEAKADLFAACGLTESSTSTGRPGRRPLRLRTNHYGALPVRDRWSQAKTVWPQLKGKR